MKHLDRITDSLIHLLSKHVELVDTVVFKLVNWRTRSVIFEEVDPMDLPEDPDTTKISLREIDLGEFYIPCPECGEKNDSLLLGIGLSQDQEDTEGDHFDITTVGMVAYSCGDIIYSPCMTDKVARILNASEHYALKPEMFTHLMECDEHGVMHTEE